MKNDHDHFSVLLAIWVLSFKILDKVRVELCMNCTRNKFHVKLSAQLVGRSVQNYEESFL